MTKNNIEVKKITSDNDLKLAHNIRYTVFVIGQNVPEEEEIDEFEDDCVHFLAMSNKVPCGAARWRMTAKGIKLERFAVLEKFRGLGVGSALVQAVIADIESNPKSHNKILYLHSQVDAVPLYKKFGFEIVGEIFQECDIDHYPMKKAQ